MFQVWRFRNDAVPTGFIKYFCLINFTIFTKHRGSGNHAFFTGFIRDSGVCDVAFAKKSVSCFAFFQNNAHSTGFIWYYCLRNSTLFIKNHGSGDHAFFTGFIRDPCGSDVAFARESVSCFAFFETMLFRWVL